MIRLTSLMRNSKSLIMTFLYLNRVRTKEFHQCLFVLLLINGVINVFGNDNNENNNNHLQSNFDVQNPKSLRTITKYQFPQFREVSPCSCDVTKNKCDIGCCCDSRCQEENNINITCIPGKTYFVDKRSLLLSKIIIVV